MNNTLNICGITFRQYSDGDIDKYKDYYNEEFVREDSRFGFVYIIVCDDNIIKIGKSTKPNQRIIAQTSRIDHQFRLKTGDDYEYFNINTIYISERHINYSKLEAILKQHLKQYQYHSSEVFNIDFKKFKKLVTSINITEFDTNLAKIKNKIVKKFNSLITQDMLVINDIKSLELNFDRDGNIINIDIKWRNTWGKLYDREDMR